MKIAIVGSEKSEVPFFKKGLKTKHLVFADTLDEVPSDTIILSSSVPPITSKTIRKLPHLKCIATRSTGFDHIDVKECEKRHITISNVPAYGENTVAEHTFALMLAVTRKIVACAERTRRGNFSLDGLRGTDLNGKTLGIVGTGKIGKAVIRIAHGFCMNVIAYDSFPDRSYAKACGFEYVNLSTLLKTSDIISLHCPLNEKTEHLINMKNVSRIKKGAILINTARGGVVETKALVHALNENILSGAGIDVLEEENKLHEEVELLVSGARLDVTTLLAEHVLIEMDNVIITPHNAFNSGEAVRRITQTTIENILAFTRGKPMNVVGLKPRK